MNEISSVITAERVANALVVGWGCAETNGRPLSELQKADMIAAALLEFDGTAADVAGADQAERIVAQMCCPAGAL